MNDPFETNRRGILNPRAGEGSYRLERQRPAPEVADWVELHWQVSWDLRGQPAYEQETLSPPCVNLVFGTHRDGLHGPLTSRFIAHLEGKGWVFGTKFHAGMFRAFVDVPLSKLTNREFCPEAIFGDTGAALDAAMHAAPGPTERLRLVSEFLVSLKPELYPDAERARDIVAIARSDRSVTRVDVLAERSDISMRALQRLFDEHVGVSPKWVLQRFRVQEAADVVADGRSVDWAALALELGYADQSHFIREFKAQVGRTPAEFAACCAASRPLPRASSA